MFSDTVAVRLLDKFQNYDNVKNKTLVSKNRWLLTSSVLEKCQLQVIKIHYVKYCGVFPTSEQPI